MYAGFHTYMYVFTLMTGSADIYMYVAYLGEYKSVTGQILGDVICVERGELTISQLILIMDTHMDDNIFQYQNSYMYVSLDN